jgi:hypothetical protein
MIYHWPCLVPVRPDTPDGGAARLPSVALCLEEPSFFQSGRISVSRSLTKYYLLKYTALTCTCR